MQNQEKRVLGRVLAVEEVRSVHGATGRDTFTGDPEGVAETSPASDVTLPIDDTSNPTAETTVQADSGTATDTGVALDCSGTRRDVFIGDVDCP